MQRPRLLIMGASVRSFAVSAARAGFEVHAADLFADLDLRAVAATVRSPRPYPDGLPTAVASQPAGAVAYTGAVENHPTVIAAIARDRPLAGCLPAAIEAVRRGAASPLDFRWFIGRHTSLKAGNGGWRGMACARPVALKQCLGLPKPLWHEVMELCGGECATLSRLEILKRDDLPEEDREPA